MSKLLEEEENLFFCQTQNSLLVGIVVSLLFSRNFPPTIVYASFFTAMGLSCVSMKTLKNHERMDLSWANNVYTTEFSVEKRLEHGFAI